MNHYRHHWQAIVRRRAFELLLANFLPFIISHTDGCDSSSVMSSVSKQSSQNIPSLSIYKYYTITLISIDQLKEVIIISIFQNK
jgi:hypothetical protein